VAAAAELGGEARSGLRHAALAERGRQLNIPAVSIPAEHAADHFTGFPFITLDVTLPNAATRELLGWEPVHPGFPATDRVRHQGVDRQARLRRPGLGVTLIPTLAVGATRTDVVLVPLHPDDSPVRKIFAATIPGRTPPASLPSFLECLGLEGCR
jgi:hypothetical protein